MTHNPEELQRRLEQATARRGSAEDTLEPETAALRAGWLAFGELLEAAQPQGDLPLPRLLLPPAPRRKRWPVVTIAVLAASLLVAATIVWPVRGTKPTTIVPPQPSQLADRDTKSDFAANQATPQTARHSPVASGNAAPWDDSLDQEISAAAQAMVSVQQDWHSQAGGLIAIEYQLQQIKQDLEGDTL